jgi:hypothetical protein
MFKGENITNFLQEYSDMCDDYRASPTIRRERLIRYISPGYREEVSSMALYLVEPYNEVALFSALRAKYSEQDWDAVRVSLDYLISLVNQASTGGITGQHFLTSFDSVSNILIRNGTLNEIGQCRELLRGLQPSVRAAIFKGTNYDPRDVSTSNYQELFKVAQRECEHSEKARRYEEVTDTAATSYRREAMKADILGHMPQERRLYRVPPQPPTAVAKESKQPDIRHLLEEVKRLALSSAELKKEVKAQIATALRQQQQHPRRQRGQSNYARPTKVVQGNICHTVGDDVGGPDEEEVCYRCFGRDKDNCLTPSSEHTLWEMCPLLTDLQNRGCMHKSVTTGQLCYGPWDPDRPSTPLFLQTNQRWFDQIRTTCHRGPYDYELDRRAANIEANRQAQQQGTPPPTSIDATTVHIINRESEEDRLYLGGQLTEVKLPDMRGLSDYYAPLPNHLSVAPSTSTFTTASASATAF